MFDLLNIKKSLSGTLFTTDDIDYVMLKIDKESDSEVLNYVYERVIKKKVKYWQFIKDELELTLFLPNDFFIKYKDKIPYVEIESDLRKIYCDVSESEIGTVTGYLLAVALALSLNDVGVYVQGAFTTDHIFVEKKDIKKSLHLLEDLKQNPEKYLSMLQI
jgi:hypothetical protein